MDKVFGWHFETEIQLITQQQLSAIVISFMVGIMWLLNYFFEMWNCLPNRVFISTEKGWCEWLYVYELNAFPFLFKILLLVEISGNL